jgi:predicted ester cyclase
MTELEDNRRVVRAFVRAINAQDWNALASIVATGFVRHSYAAGVPGVRSRDDLIQYLRSEYETFPDAHETIEDIVAEGNKVAVRHRFTGTQAGRMGQHPPSGKPMTAEYIAIYRLEGNVIVEAWAEWDNLHGLVQLGHHQSAAQPADAPDPLQRAGDL